MNHPFNTNSFRFYLKFTDFNDVWYEIAEPIGFDGVVFSKKQESLRYARSIEYLDIDKLEFPDQSTTKINYTQIVNPLGDTSDFLSYGFEWWMHALKNKGFEAVVLMKVTLNGVDFRTFQANLMHENLTDYKTFVECDFIDNTKVANFKRTIDSKFNLFADKDWGGNTITPIQTFNYLKRATALLQKSTLKQNVNFSQTVLQYGGDAHVFQPCLNVVDYEIENTLSTFLEIEYLYDTADTDVSRQMIQDRTVIKAKKRITNLKINLDNLNLGIFTSGFFTRNQLVVAYGNSPLDDWTPIQLFESTNVSFTLTNQSYEVIVPLLEIGQRVWIYFSSTNGNPIQAGTPISTVSINVTNTFKISLTAESKGLDQVIKAFRWVDMIKQASKFNQNIPVDAVLFENGGTHYENAIYNKRMISRRVDFGYTTPKDVMDSLNEVNCDYELDNDKIYIGHETDFYKNFENGAFLINPDINQTLPFNKKSAVNKMTFEYSGYEKDRTSIGTNQRVHDSIELRILNEKENFIDKKCKFIRDPLAKQKAIDLEIKQPTTETEDDNDYFIEQMTTLSPSSFGNLIAILMMRIVNGNLEIINTDSEGDVSDAPFNWNGLGIAVGNTVSIIQGVNQGNYTVSAITTEGNKITLTPILFTPTYEGNGFINLKYFYTNVAYQTRTNQGFSLIENISDTFSDLFYTPKRNVINYFGEKLANIMIYAKKNIVVAKPPTNETATTQLTTESVPVIEKADILYSSLPNPLITGRIINTSLVAEYEDVVNYLESYKVNRGFIRIHDLNGRVFRVFPDNEFAYTLSDNGLVLKEASEKFESENLTITGTINNLLVNDAPYNLSGVADWWKFENDFIQLFDEKSRPLSNKYDFNLVILNGVQFETKNELIDALLLLQS